MMITITPALEARLVAKSRLTGRTPEELVPESVEHATPDLILPEPRDEWERNVLALGINCGVSYPDHDGLGLTAAEAGMLSDDFEARFDRLEETPGIHPQWRLIVTSLGIIGKKVHDARLVAVCVVHAVSAILTFNVGHFTRLTAAVLGFAIFDPRTV